MADGRQLRWIVAGSIAIYLVWASLLIAQRPGLQYDEAALVADAVSMLHSPGELVLPHDPYTWVCPFDRCVPLMTAVYAGPIKAYLSLPLFAILGMKVEIVRLVSVFMGAILIAGVASLIAETMGNGAATAAAIVIAMNPAFVDMTVFDNGDVAPIMAATGLLCWAVAIYLKRGSAIWAFWIGAAAGFGIWAKANHLFFLAAAGVAVLIVMRGRLLAVPVSHWMVMAAGASLAGSPFLIYQLRSGGITWRGLDTFAAHESLRERMSSRLVSLAEGLLSDREHRAMWDAASMLGWQRWLFLPLTLIACAIPFFGRKQSKLDDADRGIALGKIAAITFVLLAALLLSLRVQIAEHHLVAVLPAGAMVVAFAGVMLVRNRVSAAITVFAACVYLASAMYWQIAAVQGLARTGGVGMWSDAVYGLTKGLERNYPSRAIMTPDWGLSYNVFVLSGTRIRMLERHDPLGSAAEMERLWQRAIVAGGVFVLNAPGHRFFPEVSKVFLEELDKSHVPFHKITLVQRDGGEFVEIFDTAVAAREEPAGRLSVSVLTTDEHAATQLEGFYGIENRKWRWTQPRFSITLGRPDSTWSSTSRLSVQIYVPEILIQKLGKISLAVRLNQHILPPETISRSGELNFTRPIPMEWLTDSNTFQFSLDKSIPPSASDLRELGVIVKGASLKE